MQSQFSGVIRYGGLSIDVSGVCDGFAELPAMVEKQLTATLQALACVVVASDNSGTLSDKATIAKPFTVQVATVGKLQQSDVSKLVSKLGKGKK